jgi:hypothetical protein
VADVAYYESIFTTDNTKLAAVFLTFGAPLRKHLPLEWVEEYPSKEAYIDALRNPMHQPKRIVSFNFVTEGVNVDAIAESYNDQNAQEKFVKLVRESGLDPKVIDKILEAHSRAVGSACREALEAREYLIQRIKTFPNTAKWIQVRGKGKGQLARFGYITSKEMRADLLSKID